MKSLLLIILLALLSVSCAASSPATLTEEEVTQSQQDARDERAYRRARCLLLRGEVGLVGGCNDI